MELLGGVAAQFTGKKIVPDTIAVVDRDVDMMLQYGRELEGRIVVSLLSEDVGRVGRGDTITVLPGLAGEEVFIVGEVLRDDGFVVDVYVRG